MYRNPELERLESELARLNGRLQAVEAAAQSSQPMPSKQSAQPTQPGVKHLQQSVRDLAQQYALLQEQVSALVTIAEAAAFESTASESTAFESGGNSPPQPVANHRRNSPWLPRAGRALARRAIAPIRQLWRAADPKDGLLLVPESKPTVEMPRLTVLQAVASLEELQHQPPSLSAIPEELLLWHAHTGAYVAFSKDGEAKGSEAKGGEAKGGEANDSAVAKHGKASAGELRRRQTTDVCLQLTDDSPSIATHAGILRLALLTLAMEPDLGFVEIRWSRPRVGRWLLCRWSWWHPVHQLEPRRLRAAAKGQVLGKTVQLGPDLCGVRPAGADLRPIGGYWLPADSPPRCYETKVHCAEAIEPSAWDVGLIIILTTPWTREVAAVVGTVVGAVVGSQVRGIDSLRWQCIALVDPAEDSFSPPELDGQYLPLASFFSPQIRQHALRCLLSEAAEAPIVHIGSGREFFDCEWAEQLNQRRIFDLPLPAFPNRQLDLPRPELAGTLVPAGRAKSDSSEPSLINIEFEVPAGQDAGTEEINHLRSQVGLSDDGILVVMSEDLRPENRPEDFVQLAQQAMADDRFAFVLAGDGRLAASVVDLMEFCQVTNLRLVGRRHSDLWLEASDIVVSTAESKAIPHTLLRACQLAKPILARELDGLSGWLQQGIAESVNESVGDSADASTGPPLWLALQSLAQRDLKALGNAAQRSLNERSLNEDSRDERSPTESWVAQLGLTPKPQA